MLTILVEVGERFDEENQAFIPPYVKELQLEHSLISISKWEARWNKPFLAKEDKTYDETLDYIRHMTTSKNIQEEVYSWITNKQYLVISEYINAPMTATTVPTSDGTRNREIVTSELIYYWMIALNIPFECQKWHLNRLLTLISVCNYKNSPPKKVNTAEAAKRRAELNKQRQKEYGTEG